MKIYPDNLVAQAISNSLKGPSGKDLIDIKLSAKSLEILTYYKTWLVEKVFSMNLHCVSEK